MLISPICFRVEWRKILWNCQCKSIRGERRYDAEELLTFGSWSSAFSWSAGSSPSVICVFPLRSTLPGSSPPPRSVMFASPFPMGCRQIRLGEICLAFFLGVGFLSSVFDLFRGLQAFRKYCCGPWIGGCFVLLEKAGWMVVRPVSVLIFSFFDDCPGRTAVTLALDKKFDCFQKVKQSDVN